MKIILFSDLHFHPHEVLSVILNGDNSRLLDAVDFLKSIKTFAAENDINHIISLGDFFHTRKKIDVEVYDKAYDLVKEFKGSGFEFYLIAGNHDIYYKNTAKVTSLRPLSKYAHVITHPTQVQLGSASIVMIPYMEQLQTLTDAIQKYSSLPNLVYMLHTEFMGAQRSSFGNDVAKHGITADIFPQSAKVYMGHYHPYQSLTPNIKYLGSPLQISTREIHEDKFFFIFDTETREVTPVRSPTPRFAVIEYPSGKVLKFHDKQMAIADIIRGNYVEVVAHETIKKTNELAKLLPTARNYIVNTKIVTKNNSNRQDADMNLDDIDMISLSDLYLTDHPHEFLPTEFLKNVRQKIVNI